MCYIFRLQFNLDSFVFVSKDFGSYIIGDAEIMKLLNLFGMIDSFSAFVPIFDIFSSSFRNLFNMFELRDKYTLFVHEEEVCRSSKSFGTIRCSLIIPIDGYFLFRLWINFDMMVSFDTLFVLCKDRFCGAYTESGFLTAVSKPEIASFLLSGRLKEFVF